ncbi:hypothetical protein BJ875DRAFT_547069 [Amylocarpus encephaloides]|uniref:Uncharacterized protein n=1 Tax=Amylocarpus encephaloides TaxID=45428 RepID=A0A9P7Y8U9_9HELO|nr:hypothetical protein BJ875DRAFT_547069 [Amylocarpus encephaloides]
MGHDPCAVEEKNAPENGAVVEITNVAKRRGKETREEVDVGVDGAMREVVLMCRNLWINSIRSTLYRPGLTRSSDHVMAIFSGVQLARRSSRLASISPFLALSLSTSYYTSPPETQYTLHTTTILQSSMVALTALPQWPPRESLCFELTLEDRDGDYATTPYWNPEWKLRLLTADWDDLLEALKSHFGRSQIVANADSDYRHSNIDA